MKWEKICPVMLAVAVVAVAAADVLWGGMAGADQFVIAKIRLPRVAVALIAGASLALGGLQMQSIFRNPLADPHIMGVSAGAGLGAAVAVLAGGMGVLGVAMGGLTIAVAAFMGAVLASVMIMLVSARVKSSSTLLIFGIMLGFIFNAIVALMQFSSNAEALKVYYSWAAGSFSNCSWEQVAVLGACLAAGIILALVNVKGLNIILFGDEYASLTGAKVKTVRTLSMVGCCLLAGSVTAFCGPLGFVGIVAPHIARWITGSSDHRRTIPTGILAGAGLCAAADLAAQLWTRWSSAVPAGSMLAVIGIPMVLIILLARRERI